MKLCKRKKNDVIYYQGDDADNFYILIKGQLRLVKKASLFKENPNDMYIDRRKLVDQIHKDDKKYRTTRSLKKENDDVLPFANFTTLYNYRPMKKMIEIGVVSSFGLFGEEEVVCKTPRETTTLVDSLDACYYEVNYKRVLEIIGAKQVEKFKNVLEHSVSKKILYRQN